MATLWIDDLLRRIAAHQASDLVLDPEDDGSLAVRLRIGGLYRTIEHCPASQATGAIARLKALAGQPAYIVDEPQDGRIDGKPFAIAGDLRAAFIPTVRGPRAAIRLPAIGALPDPDHLGLPAPVVAGLRAVLRRPQGLLVVCGPTGSGKTTTIHALLAELARERADRAILAIEDPVERRLPGVVQVEVRPHLGLDFAAGLRAGLRQDPDVLVIGEVRDPETARIAVRTALTGHLVVTTLHCGRAAECLPRLIEMGVDRDLVVPTIAGVLAQRLLRTVHGACNGAGCDGCQSGYDGRIPVADWCAPDHTARLAWADGRAPALAADLTDQAAQLVASGRTTAAEVARVVGA